MIRAKILGTGAAVPKKILSNADLEKLVETSDEWIISRTGIRERHIASDGEHFSDFCTRAAELALKRAHVKPEDLDMILVGTISGDMPFPATSCLVQRNLGATRAAAGHLRGLRRLSLRPAPRRRPDPVGQGAERARHRRRDPVALRGLDRPQHLRALRRRRRRGRAPGDQGATTASSAAS